METDEFFGATKVSVQWETLLCVHQEIKCLENRKRLYVVQTSCINRSATVMTIHEYQVSTRVRLPGSVRGVAQDMGGKKRRDDPLTAPSNSGCAP